MIGLKKYPLGDLRLESVDTTLANSVLDLAQARMIDSPVSPFTEITSLVPEYSPIKASEAINSASFVLTDAETLIVIPMVYQDLTLRTPQFPLIVTYSYSGNQYQFVLDDFIFFQNHDYAEKSDSDVWRYLYQY